MSQVIVISLIVLFAALIIGAALLKALLVQVCKLHFGIEHGVHDPDARRRFREFEWYCWKAYGCVSTICSLQEFVEPPFNWLADFSGLVMPLQFLFGLGALAFGLAAVNRFREPLTY